MTTPEAPAAPTAPTESTATDNTATETVPVADASGPTPPSSGPEPIGSRPASLRAARLVLVASVVFAAVGLAIGGIGLVRSNREPNWVSVSSDGPAPQLDPLTHEVTFVVPAGTARRQAAGEAVVVLPSRVTIKVEQRLSIRNDDDKAVVIGPFFVAPHGVSTYHFASPRTLEGACELHPSGQFTVEVTA